MVLRVENFNILGILWKIRLLGGHEKAIYRGGLPEKWGLGQFGDLRRELDKREGVVFLRAVDTSMHTM